MKTISTLSTALVLVLFLMTPSLQAQDTLQVMATGSQSVPPVGSNGTGMFTVIKTEDSLKVKGEFEELSSYYTGAYIQLAEKREQGNVLFTLSASDLNKPHTAGRLKMEDNTFHLNKVLERYFNQGMLYINIATNDHSQGEVRGQIVP